MLNQSHSKIPSSFTFNLLFHFEIIYFYYYYHYFVIIVVITTTIIIIIIIIIISMFCFFLKCLYDPYQVPPRNLRYAIVVKTGLKFEVCCIYLVLNIDRWIDR